MGKLLSLFSGFAGSGTGLIILALVWTLSLGFAGYKGYGMGEDHALAEQAKQEQVTQQIVDKAKVELQGQFSGIMQSYLSQYAITKEIHDKVIVKVPTYITKEVDAKCEVNRGFVEIHNSSAMNVEPAPVDETTKLDSGVKLSEVGSVVSTNYSICNQNAAKLIALQAEVRAYKAKIDSLAKGK